MRIGKVSGLTGLSRDTIRFYEKRKLIEVPRTESDWNNYKDYDQAHIDRLLMIKRCKGFGFTLHEIADILELIDRNEATCDTLAERAKQKLLDIDEKIMALERIKAMIKEKVETTTADCDPQRDRNKNCPEASLSVK